MCIRFAIVILVISFLLFGLATYAPDRLRLPANGRLCTMKSSVMLSCFVSVCVRVCGAWVQYLTVSPFFPYFPLYPCHFAIDRMSYSFHSSTLAHSNFENICLRCQRQILNSSVAYLEFNGYLMRFPHRKIVRPSTHFQVVIGI